MLPASRFNQSVEFLKRLTVADDGYGNVTSNFSLFITRRADIKTGSSAERLKSGVLSSEIHAVATIRADAESRLITASDQLSVVAGPMAGRRGNIIAVRPLPSNREIEIDFVVNQTA